MEDQIGVPEGERYVAASGSGAEWGHPGGRHHHPHHGPRFFGPPPPEHYGIGPRMHHHPHHPIRGFGHPGPYRHGGWRDCHGPHGRGGWGDCDEEAYGPHQCERSMRCDGRGRARGLWLPEERQAMCEKFSQGGGRFWSVVSDFGRFMAQKS
eukprot:Trichotokara_eunicae@DN6238_c1_g1_i6.p1